MGTSTSTTPNEAYCSPASGAIQIGLLTNPPNSIFQTIQETYCCVCHPKFRNVVKFPQTQFLWLNLSPIQFKSISKSNSLRRL